VFEQLDGREPIVCSVAELRDSKGIEALVAAMPAILARHPRAALVVAGDGSERAKLESQVQELDLSESVRLIGDTPGPASVLSGSAAFVNPAYAEAFPYTIIEAMSFPLPVVATDVGGSGEAIEDGLTGLLVEPRNPGALAGAVDRLATDAGLGERLAAAARERWREEFTVERMIDSTLAVYADVGVGAADGRLS
jgi:glycosyltransferase involved in cell wall biosynthesis